MAHRFIGKWITDGEFFELEPRNVFFRQLERIKLPCEEHRNRHILFRKRFECPVSGGNAKLYISADDYYKVYINGRFAGQGPAPSYHFRYNYNVIDVGDYLKQSENVIAVHTLYQGLINRVWQSGDNRHGLLLDLTVNDRVIVSSDESFKTHPHSGYEEMGVCGYQTQFLERYDSGAAEIGFEAPDFDDSGWEQARLHRFDDHVMVEQASRMLEFENISPAVTKKEGNCIFCDFGANYVGYLCVTARGKRGDTVTVRCGQELTEEGKVRFALRANCRYEEEWSLSDGISRLDQFDYKTFRYAELTVPEGVELLEVRLLARHYPFTLKTSLSPRLSDSADLRRVWALCVRTQQYGVQEVIQDCMEREKGFYLGDGCYTALTHMLLTEDDSMVRKLIDDAFATEFIADTLMTCMDCSFMQEIAEYPLILVYLVLWHYRYTQDKQYLQENAKKVNRLLDAYRRHYERDGLLRDLDKWCVVEWPKNFQGGYDVDITEGKVCHETHVSINAYYMEAIRTANKIAEVLELPPYRDEAPVLSAFYGTFYDRKRHLFRDGEDTDHVSLVGNSFIYGFDLCPDETCRQSILSLLRENGIHTLSLFCSFIVLLGFVRNGRFDLIREALLDDGAWRRILREGGTATFEGWGKETKNNASLFHLTMSYAAAFMADVDLQALLG